VTDISNLYPTAPFGIPPELTRPDARYRLRVAAMIAGLFAFLLFYLSLIALAAFGAWWLMDLTSRGRGHILLTLGGALCAGLLCLFLLKGLFKGNRIARTGRIPLEEREHPRLFAFIRRVYEDVGAPAPRRVYASPDVNAALVYDTSLVNLILPPKKDLLIGLGVVNVVDLAEFKAVLAHEFGHFGQRSIGLGSYLAVANQVMHDIVYRRDALDAFVDGWCTVDLRVSFPAWGLKGILWVIRGVLSGAYRWLNLLHLSLGRQMEFNADNVAVSVTGSDSLIHGLSRLEFAGECLADAARSLDAAADHGLFTNDLYFHTARAAERLRIVRRQPRLGIPPELPANPAEHSLAFTPKDDGIPDRYRTHPPDHLREQNAKRFYVRSPIDTRSPWLLFDKVPDLKWEMTTVFYKEMLQRRERFELRPAEEVHAFISAEHEETTYDPKYHGYYDDRFIAPGDLNDGRGETWRDGEIDGWLSGWPPPDFESLLDGYRSRLNDANTLSGLNTGDYKLKGRTFRFREQECTKKDVLRLLSQVEGELERDREAFQRFDRSAFLVHASIARTLDRSLGGQRAVDLLDRYRFHSAVQGLLHGMVGEQGRLIGLMNSLSGKRELDEATFHYVRDSLADIHGALLGNLHDSKRFQTPAMRNVPAGTVLYDLIIDRGDRELPHLSSQSISGVWLNKLMTRLDGVLSRIRRVHFKSLGGILAVQDKLATEWRNRPIALPDDAIQG